MKNIFMYILLCMCLWLSSCSSEQNEQTVAVGIFPVVNPIIVDTVFNSNYVTSLQSIQVVEIRPRLKGVLDKVLVDEGDVVRAGQVLFQMNNPEIKAALMKSKAQLKMLLAEKKSIQIELSNARKLFAKSIIASTEVELLEAKMDGVVARLEELEVEILNFKTQLGFTQIKAPFAGVINRIPFKAGALVDENNVLTKLYNNREMYAYFNLSEVEYLKMLTNSKSGSNQSVDLILADGTKYPFKGFIETTDAEFNSNTGSIAFRAKFKNPHGLLKNGSSGKIQISQPFNKSLIIPQKSTFEVQDKTFVYVVSSTGEVQVKSIQVINRQSDLYVIEGLSQTDNVIYEGIQRVKEGDIIQIKRLGRSAILRSSKL